MYQCGVVAVDTLNHVDGVLEQGPADVLEELSGVVTSQQGGGHSTNGNVLRSVQRIEVRRVLRHGVEEEHHVSLLLRILGHDVLPRRVS